MLCFYSWTTHWTNCEQLLIFTFFCFLELVLNSTRNDSKYLWFRWTYDRRLNHILCITPQCWIYIGWHENRDWATYRCAVWVNAADDRFPMLEFFRYCRDCQTGNKANRKKTHLKGLPKNISYDLWLYITLHQFLWWNAYKHYYFFASYFSKFWRCDLSILDSIETINNYDVTFYG